MRNTLLMSVLLGMCSFASAQTPLASHPSATPGQITSHVYTFTGRYDRPLTAYDACNAYSPAGRVAGDFAESNALGSCWEDFNMDCVLENKKFRIYNSTEFVGYSLCEATAYVRGYRAF